MSIVFVCCMIQIYTHKHTAHKYNKKKKTASAKPAFAFIFCAAYSDVVNNVVQHTQIIVYLGKIYINLSYTCVCVRIKKKMLHEMALTSGGILKII